MNAVLKSLVAFALSFGSFDLWSVPAAARQIPGVERCAKVAALCRINAKRRGDYINCMANNRCGGWR